MARKLMLLLCALCFVEAVLHVGSPALAQVERKDDFLAITLTDDQFGNALHGLPVTLTPRQIAKVAELIGAKPAALVIPMEAFVGTRLLPVLRIPVSYFFK